MRVGTGWLLTFLQNSDEDTFKPLGPLEDIQPVVTEGDREAEFDAEEVRWWELGEFEDGA